MNPEEKIKEFKKVVIGLLAIILVLMGLLSFNYVELKKYDAIATGEYITVAQCEELFRPIDFDDDLIYVENLMEDAPQIDGIPLE